MKDISSYRKSFINRETIFDRNGCIEIQSILEQSDKDNDNYTRLNSLAPIGCVSRTMLFEILGDSSLDHCIESGILNNESETISYVVGIKRMPNLFGQSLRVCVGYIINIVNDLNS